MRNSIIVDTLRSVYIVEIVKCGVDIFEISEGFFCPNLENIILIQNLLLICLKKEICLNHKETI